MKRSLICLVFFLTFSNGVFSNSKGYQSFPHSHLYAGLTLAHGETAWKNLVSDDFIVQISAPKSAEDYGTAWGGFLGYQFGQQFALEATYLRYPNTRILLDEFSFYYPITDLTTHTQAYSMIGKFILPVANGRVSVYLDAGAGFTHRNDVLAKVTRVAPTFGLGFIANVTQHIMSQLGFAYYIGYGRSERRPVDDFVPFLFSVYFRLGYRFS
jgi:hypothetical protein